MIFNSEPNDWRDLQQKVCQTFLEMGCIAEVEKTVNTVRGKVSIDVYVNDNRGKPELIYICECKYWNTPVPQTVVHSFQTVVSNIGAHVGYIISKNGFQSGAYEAVSNTNIFLVSWEQFQEMLFDSWRKNMFKEIEKFGKNFSEYLDYFSGPPRDADDSEKLSLLCEKYHVYLFVSPYSNTMNSSKLIKFPLHCIDPRGDISKKDRIAITNYRDFFDILNEAKETGIKAFVDFRAFLKEKHGRD